MRLIIARHGETDWNAAEKLQGDIDIPLSDRGKRQAIELSVGLADEKIDVIYASALQRAQATARPVVAYHQVPYIIDPRLNEFDWGIFKGIPRDERNAHPELGPLWKEVQANLRTTNKHQGELFVDFEARIQSVLTELTDNHPDATVLVVGHGAVKRMMLSLMFGTEYEDLWKEQWSNGSYSIIRSTPKGFANRFEVEKLHVTDHLTD